MRSTPHIALALFLALSVAACGDEFLAEEDVAGATPSLYRTAGGFNQGVNGAYQGARSFWGEQSGGNMADVGTDIWTNGRGGNQQFFSTYEPELNSQAGYVEDTWEDFYEGINAINTVLAAAPDVEGLSADERAVRVGELKFLRALYYFHLARWFGPIPLHLEPVTGVVTEERRAPVSEVYDVIIQDLQEAADALPEEQSAWGRATRGAAQHLLALVHLTRGHMTNSAADFETAASLAETVIGSGPYALLEDFADVFDINNQRNAEVIWSVQYTQDERLNGGGNNAHLFYLSAYDELPGMQRTTEGGRPWNRFRPTEFLVNSYEIDRDARWEKSFQTVWCANDPDGLPEGVALGDTAVYMPHPSVDPSRYEGKPYLVLPPDDYLNNFSYFPALTKHLDPLRPSVQWTAGSRDFIVFRLAETHLIAAEALHMLGNDAEAAQHLNAVRERAAWPGQEAEMQIAPGEVTLDFILDEWGRETAGEYQRWFTLVRVGRLVERVRKYNPWSAPNIQDYHALRPIPQSQIDAVTTPFDQNPGY